MGNLVFLILAILTGMSIAYAALFIVLAWAEATSREPGQSRKFRVRRCSKVTNNQINLAKLREEERHNKIYEAEQARHNLASEALTQRQLSESERSNLAREAETHRSNVASEVNKERERVTKYETALMERLPIASIVANPMTLEVFEHLVSLVTGQQLNEGDSYADMTSTRQIITTILNMFLPEDIAIWNEGQTLESIKEFIRRGIYGNSSLSDDEKEQLGKAFEIAEDAVENSPELVAEEVAKYRAAAGAGTQKSYHKTITDGKSI